MPQPIAYALASPRALWEKTRLERSKNNSKEEKMEQKITILAFAVGSLLQAARHVAI